MRLKRSIVGTESECAEALSLIDKALNYPRPGVHVGGGRHVDMPDTWDGKGDCPPGWSKTHAQILINTPLDAAIELDDAESTQLVTNDARSRLTVSERLRLANKLANRTIVDLDGRVPRAELATETLETKGD